MVSVEKPRPPTILRVLVGGDLLPHRPLLIDPPRIGQALAPLAQLFGGANMVVANYETSTGDPRLVGDKPMTLVVSEAWMAELKRAKIGALTIANNHACDLGEAGLDATLATANELGLTAIGADAQDHDPWKARVLAEADGHRVCAVAWTTFLNGGSGACGDDTKIALAASKKRDPARIARAITRAKQEQHCDVVIAIIHGGKEYAPQIILPRKQARVAAEAGADAVVVHHPHVPAPVHVITTKDGRSVPVFLSVGNLVSNQGESWKIPYFPVRADRHHVSMNAWTRLGMIADLAFTWDATSGTPATAATLAWGYHLVWTDNEHAIHHDDPAPRIAVRLVDRAADRELTTLLGRDKEGPRELFSSRCWLDGASARCNSRDNSP